MRYWISTLLLICCIQSLMAQDHRVDNAPGTVFFQARDDTDQDGQVTEADNIRMYQAASDGRLLFATEPYEHVLLASAINDPEFGLVLATIIQHTDENGDQGLYLQIQTSTIGYDRHSSHTAYITHLELKPQALVVWEERTKEGEDLRYTLNFRTGYYLDDILPASPTSEPESTQASETRLERTSLYSGLGAIVPVVQRLDLPPRDSLALATPTGDIPLSTWLLGEPLLIASHPTMPQLAVLEREMDGSMSLVTLDFSAALDDNGELLSDMNNVIVTQQASNLIDPIYTSMQWSADGSTLFLTGESGDFVVTTIGRPEALYAFDLNTKSFTRLSPDGTFVERDTVISQ